MNLLERILRLNDKSVRKAPLEEAVMQIHESRRIPGTGNVPSVDVDLDRELGITRERCRGYDVHEETVDIFGRGGQIVDLTYGSSDGSPKPYLSIKIWGVPRSNSIQCLRADSKVVELNTYLRQFHNCPVDNKIYACNEPPVHRHII